MALELRNAKIAIEHDCAECEGVGTVYDPTGFGWADLVKLDNAAFEEAVADHEGPLPPEEGPCAASRGGAG